MGGQKYFPSVAWFAHPWLAGYPEFSKQHHYSVSKWRLLFQLPPNVRCGQWLFFEWTQHSADRNSLSAMPEVISRRFPALCCPTFSRDTCYSETSPPGAAKATATRTESKAHEVNIDNWDPTFLTPQEIPVRSASAFLEWQRGGAECRTVDPILGGRLLRYKDTKIGPTVWQCLNSGSEFV